MLRKEIKYFWLHPHGSAPKVDGVYSGQISPVVFADINHVQNEHKKRIQQGLMSRLLQYIAFVLARFI